MKKQLRVPVIALLAASLAVAVAVPLLDEEVSTSSGTHIINAPPPILTDETTTPTLQSFTFAPGFNEELPAVIITDRGFDTSNFDPQPYTLRYADAFDLFDYVDPSGNPDQELKALFAEFDSASSTATPDTPSRRLASDSLEAPTQAHIAGGPGSAQPGRAFTYDPAQRTVSAGDLWRVTNGVDERSVRFRALEAAPSAPADRYAVADYDSTAGTVSTGEIRRFRNVDFDGGPGRYIDYVEQAFRSAAGHVSTFSMGVDTASYTNIRRYIRSGVLPPPGAVRIEEMVNYFKYDYTAPEGPSPFAVSTEVAACPWNLDQRLLRIGVRTTTIDRESAPPANLVFLIDVSGSMSPGERLPLVQRAFRDFVPELREQDRVSIVVYAGEVGLKLDATPGNETMTILSAMDGLVARGGTRGGEAIQTAYRVARENFIEGGVNRIILATDGDFNVGVSNIDELAKMVATEAESGVSMSILGVGRQINDGMMQRFSSQGNATYYYLDTLEEARRVLVEEIGGTLFTVAEDFKSQVVFNPELVDSWRLVGYDTRQLAARDFDNDDVKAGDVGAGLTTTYFYQVVLRGTESAGDPGVVVEQGEAGEDELELISSQENWAGELARVKLRYKNPGEETSNLVEFNVRDDGRDLLAASEEFVFAASVASYGMLLRRSEHIELLSMETVEQLAESAAGNDPRRREFVDLVRETRRLMEARGE